ncbi:Taurochenodeoxycholic 6 alpha-hydroxylase [Orchesella cincta]|uniref:Taurochenodeoxycholic 6 alpha-hydroxylase n=1 Tax=Orchesella cincta TaxID=48709 RepID=A0A1D2M2C6_ORCCI|nr:Taurochenodeoxycholic 6 alpha-hydroxylase [Orchesella cincta]
MEAALEKISVAVRNLGPIFRTKLFSEEIVVLNSPEYSQHVLKSKEMGHLPKPYLLYETLHDMLGNGLILSQGEYWHSQRKLLSKGFTYGALRSYTKIYNKCAKRFVGDLGKLFEGENRYEYQQINTMIHLCGIQIITEVVMGLDTWKDKEEAERVADSFTSLKNIAFQRIRQGLGLLWDPIWKLHPLGREYRRNVRDIDNVIQNLIARYRTINGEQEIKHSKRIVNISEPSKSDDDDDYEAPQFDNMLEMMFKAGLTEKQIVAEVKTLIWAGYETTSTATHFLLFLLASNKEHQDACREEVDRIFNDTKLCPTSGELTLEALSEMKQLERCLFETLRMIPVIGSVTRKLESPLKIPGDENLEIPAGINVNVPMGLHHRLPEYFPNPEKFDPDRFLPENSARRQPTLLFLFRLDQGTALV